MDKNLVICPVYNEQDTIEKFYVNLRRYYQHSILFVDDGSVDSGRDFLDKIENEQTFVLRHPQRSGYGTTLISGFNFARAHGFKKIVTIDVDLQHSPEHIPDFLNALDDFEVVLGSRYILIDKLLDIPRMRLLINRYISRLLKVLFKVKITDPFCGFRAYTDTFLQKICLKETSYGLSLEILLEMIRLNVNFKEVPIEAIYFQKPRKFLDGLEMPQKRLLYYLAIIERKKRMIKNERQISYR